MTKYYLRQQLLTYCCVIRNVQIKNKIKRKSFECTIIVQKCCQITVEIS